MFYTDAHTCPGTPTDQLSLVHTNKKKFICADFHGELHSLGAGVSSVAGAVSSAFSGSGAAGSDGLAVAVSAAAAGASAGGSCGWSAGAASGAASVSGVGLAASGWVSSAAGGVATVVSSGAVEAGSSAGVASPASAGDWSGRVTLSSSLFPVSFAVPVVLAPLLSSGLELGRAGSTVEVCELVEHPILSCVHTAQRVQL